FWLDNNTRFEQGKAEFERRIVETKGACSIDDLSVYYKQYQLDSYERHLKYNRYVWRRSFSMVWPGVRAWAVDIRRRRARRVLAVAKHSEQGYFDRGPLAEQRLDAPQQHPSADSSPELDALKDECGIWPRIEKEFTARLPLRNLIWKGGITQTARFVEQLDIAISHAEGGQPAHDSPIPDQQTAPLLHIYLLETLDADADTYKAIVRPRAKSWATRASQRKGEEWLVIYLPNAAEVQKMATTSKFLNMRASVFDKLKGDLQVKKDVERVVMLQPASVESWNAAFLAIRDRVVQALDDRVASIAEEIRRMDANRMLPGWNYCKFFVFKEGLVNLYRLMGLRDGALAQYDELEAAYLQLFNSQRLSWFSKFGGSEPGDDYTDLLDLSKKPYRQQMIENTISMFDFRIYLFGQQCQLLIDMSRYNELVERAQRFIATFAKSMREPGTGLTLAFVSSWVYSTCQNIVEICEG
ncbi:hypothetical protein LPJ61_006128, partial [Coemansia biformis]